MNMGLLAATPYTLNHYNMKLTLAKKRKVDALLASYRLKIKNKTRTKQSELWKEYRERKYSLTHTSPFPEVAIVRRKNLKAGRTEVYKVRKKNTNLEKLTSKLAKQKNIRYVLVILTIRIDGIEKIVSDSFTPEAIRMIEKYDISLLESVLQKMRASERYEGFELISVHIKLIYESAKKNKHN